MHVWMKQGSRLLPLLSPSAKTLENVTVNAFSKVLMIMQMPGCQLSILLNKTSQFRCSTASDYVISSVSFAVKKKM